MSVGKFGDTWTTADKRVDRTAPPAERGRTAPVGLSVQQELSRTPSLAQRLRSGPVQGVGFDDAVQLADGAAVVLRDGELTWIGPMWTLVVDDGETHRLMAALASGSKVAMLAGPYGKVIAAVLRVSRDYIETVDALGGHNGVEITGLLNNTGILVVPRGLPSLAKDLVDAGKLVVAGKTVMDFVIIASAYSPTVRAALGLPIVGSVFSAVSAGTPLGWALAAGVGWVLGELTGPPAPEEFGALLADRVAVGPWESFLVASLGNGEISILAHSGLFSADSGGGGGVHANRVEVGAWERWGLLRHGDGTVSVRSSKGHLLSEEGGGGAECNANRTKVGDWERFRMHTLPSGRIALQTLVKGTYVSAQL